MDSERERLKKRFKKTMEGYLPNLKEIANQKQEIDKDAPEDPYTRRLTSFCSAMRQIRSESNLSVIQMAERLGYSRTNIYKIENEEIKRIPFDKFKQISKIFEVSPAYLLGLVEEATEFPKLSQYYFWEHPNNDFLEIKNDVIEKSDIAPMAFWGNPKKELLDMVTRELANDYNLLYSLSVILKSDPKKKKYIFDIIKSFAEII
jgi:transcriptional regulator with XRE-family HTH domain